MAFVYFTNNDGERLAVNSHHVIHLLDHPAGTFIQQTNGNVLVREDLDTVTRRLQEAR